MHKQVFRRFLGGIQLGERLDGDGSCLFHAKDSLAVSFVSGQELHES